MTSWVPYDMRFEVHEVLDQLTFLPPTIIEAGACDLATTVAMAEYLCSSLKDFTVHAFECNPSSVALCQERLKGLPEKLASRIRFNPVALLAKDRDAVPFLAIDTDAMIRESRTSHPTGNPGASSFLPANPKYPFESYVQKPVAVPAMTLDGYCCLNHIQRIDLLWLDAQGSELEILRGAGPILASTGAVYTEVGYRQVYLGQPLQTEVESFLIAAGFDKIRAWKRCDWFGNELYVRRPFTYPPESEATMAELREEYQERVRIYNEACVRRPVVQ